MKLPTYGDERAFLEKYTDVLELRHDKTRILVCPLLQGRIMTSSARGDAGASFGWINHDLIASGDARPPAFPVGGEDRLWIGPQAGKFSMFHAPGTPLDVEHYRTPAPLDTESWDVTESTERILTMSKKMTLQNHAGTEFDIEMDRRARLLVDDEMLPDEIAGLIDVVGFESVTTIRNAGANAWTEESGLPSLWSIGMFHATSTSKAGILLKPGHHDALRSYFGPLPAGVAEGLGTRRVSLKTDGQTLFKVGIPPDASPTIIAGFDPKAEYLTFVMTIPTEDVPPRYVNSRFETPHDPYDGDLFNIYNDGPATPGGGQLGRFYELESSSPGAALGPGEELTHFHRTMHMMAAPSMLAGIARLMGA